MIVHRSVQNFGACDLSVPFQAARRQVTWEKYFCISVRSHGGCLVDRYEDIDSLATLFSRLFTRFSGGCVLSLLRHARRRWKRRGRFNHIGSSWSPYMLSSKSAVRNLIEFVFYSITSATSVFYAEQKRKTCRRYLASGASIRVVPTSWADQLLFLSESGLILTKSIWIR